MNPPDSLHAWPKVLTAGYSGLIITTEFLLLVTATFLARGTGRGAFRDVVRDLRSDPRTTILPCSPQYFERGFQLFVARPDKQ